MNKVILVMNDPMFCCNCPLTRERPRRGGYICCIGHPGDGFVDWVYEPVDMDSEVRPDWCPLKELPNRFIYFGEDDYAEGYNDCLDEILGE